jgi:hypothetical protein
MRIAPVTSNFETRRPHRRDSNSFQVAMDRHPSHSPKDDSEFVARSIHADFNDLVAVFDRQLSELPEADTNMRPHIVEARSAAARGLLLSRKLVEVLRSSH